MKKNLKVVLIPEGYHTVTPFVIVEGAEKLIDFMINAFNAIEMGRGHWRGWRYLSR